MLAEEGLQGEAPSSPQNLVQRAFTQHNAFDEFVRAAEGVPRDGINILELAATRAGDDLISIPHIRSAARAWYQRDKEAALSHEAHELLNWIMSVVIGSRQARAFMLMQGADRRHPLIGALYDAQASSISFAAVSPLANQPGVRFNGWGLDYGCYVDLVNTVKAPKGLFQVAAQEDMAESFVEVPTDDYRSIRRAILDLTEFEKRQPELDLRRVERSPDSFEAS